LADALAGLLGWTSDTLFEHDEHDEDEKEGI